MTSAALEVQGLVKRYGERAALAGVTFSLPRGCLVALLGRGGPVPPDGGFVTVCVCTRPRR